VSTFHIIIMPRSSARGDVICMCEISYGRTTNYHPLEVLLMLTCSKSPLTQG